MEMWCEMKKPKIGQRVIAKTDRPVFWTAGPVGPKKKVGDIVRGMHGIVCGYNGDVPIVNIVETLLPVALGGFEEAWELDED